MWDDPGFECVAPEVSSLDFANGLTFNGFTIPGLDTRRVLTEIEVEDGQSFANRGDCLTIGTRKASARSPVWGTSRSLESCFRPRTINKNNSELLVIGDARDRL